MKTFLIRAGSAIVAVFFVSAFVYYGDLNGVRILTLIAVLLAVREGTRILLPKAPDLLRPFFSVLCVALFIFGVVNPAQLALTFGLCTVLLISTSLLLHKKFSDLSEMLRFHAHSVLGFIYLAILPVFAVSLLDLKNGLVWFLALLAFVFAGDTAAYLVGWKFGRRLLMPVISPKKTIEGAIGGLLGSCATTFIFRLYLAHIPIVYLLTLALVVCATGQLGDLFESMLKRVANQKDSGTLMPGHGGVLDRIDGVLFAAPVMLAGASLLEKWF